MKCFNLILIVLSAALLVAAQQFNNVHYDVGDKVSDFKLLNVEGNHVALSDYKNSKGVIIVFDCNTCPYSKAYHQRILALHKKYEGIGFPLIAINSNDPIKSPGDSYDEMVTHAKNDNYPFPYLFDESQSVAHSFGAKSTPHVFVLENQSEGFIVVYSGTIDNNIRDASSADKKYVEEAIEALLNHSVVITSKTKAIGCGIQWKD